MVRIVLTLHKILVAIDRSAIGEQVLQEALPLAKVAGAEIMLLHVLSPEESTCPQLLPSTSLLGGYTELTTIGVENFRSRWEQYANECLEMLQSYLDEATAAGVKAQFHQVVGSPGRTICDCAATWNADTIVMGRRGLSELSELFVGSVSNYVVHHALCSVWIVRS
ncbi:universal stress protein [Oscillatoriales cyanobacterium LEGE 11467]|uniref:Universal stress protein n=1 Tax=Zarconia navalis LEGE 11467 TaxID=1828826 RepID=A0A928Z9K3_9CYAN|nr:universal stress protein [Zarconia navalis]MBE9040856.1 universal stress protein [Zarconia navalis LEGE 11467]